MDLQTFVIAFGSAFIWAYCLYWVIRRAVRHGILDADQDRAVWKADSESVSVNAEASRFRGTERVHSNDQDQLQKRFNELKRKRENQ